MNREDITRMAREAGFLIDGVQEFVFAPSSFHFTKELSAFASLVAAAEREKSLRLWMLLDDVDTADDIAKADDDIYRSLCRQAHAKRWAVLNGNEVDAAIRARGENT